jgi:hypothetical protein
MTQDSAWMRFVKITTWGQIIHPSPPMRGYRKGDEYIVESFAECYCYEVQDFVANETGESGWLIQFDDPQYKNHKFIWTLRKV